MKIRKTATFETAPAGTHPAVITTVADLGIQASSWSGIAHRAQKLGITFELGGLKTKDGRPFAVFATYTASLHEKSRLTPVVRAALGEEPEELDTQALLTKAVLVEVVHHQDKEGRTWANVKTVIALPDPGAAPKTETAPLHFELEQPDPEVFKQLPARFRTLIENRVRQSELAPVAAGPDPDDDVAY